MSQHFRDLLAEFNAHRVEYIVVGAHAVAAHGHVRATKDLVPPLRIDVITAIDGVEFADGWRERVETVFAGEPVFVLSSHLLM